MPGLRAHRSNGLARTLAESAMILSVVLVVTYLLFRTLIFRIINRTRVCLVINLVVIIFAAIVFIYSPPAVGFSRPATRHTNIDIILKTTSITRFHRSKYFRHNS